MHFVSFLTMTFSYAFLLAPESKSDRVSSRGKHSHKMVSLVLVLFRLSLTHTRLSTIVPSIRCRSNGIPLNSMSHGLGSDGSCNNPRKRPSLLLLLLMEYGTFREQVRSRRSFHCRKTYPVPSISR